MIKLYYTPETQSFHLTLRADSGSHFIGEFDEAILKSGSFREFLGCLSVLRSRSVQEIRESVAIFIKRYGN